MTDIEEMSEEELRARGDAAVIGQLQVIQVVLGALVWEMRSTEYLEFALAQKLATIANQDIPEPEMEWSRGATLDGANALADYFTDLCRQKREMAR